MARVSRDEYFMSIAQVVATRSTCKRAAVGAVLVDYHTKHIVATGYNGAAPQAPHCIDVGCLMEDGHCIRTIHAEMNAILQLDKRYEYLILYCTHQPCYECMKALIGARVREIYYINPYPDTRRERILAEIPLPPYMRRYNEITERNQGPKV